MSNEEAVSVDQDPPLALCIRLNGRVLLLPNAGAALDLMARNDGETQDTAKWCRQVCYALAKRGEYVSKEASAAELVTALFRREFVVGSWLQ